MLLHSNWIRALQMVSQEKSPQARELQIRDSVKYRASSKWIILNVYTCTHHFLLSHEHILSAWSLPSPKGPRHIIWGKQLHTAHMYERQLYELQWAEDSGSRRQLLTAPLSALLLHHRPSEEQEVSVFESLWLSMSMHFSRTVCRWLINLLNLTLVTVLFFHFWTEPGVLILFPAQSSTIFCMQAGA